MKKMLMTLALGIAVMGSLSAVPAMAQVDNGGGNGGGGQNGGGPGGGRGGRGGRGNFQQFQQQRMDRIKTAMGVTDDEWKALEPKITAVQQLEMQQRMGGMMRRRPPQDQNADQNTPTNPVAAAEQALQTTLDNKDATPDQIKSKLDALRAAKTKSAADLKKAQDELKELLTVRQEAVLVTQNILE